MPELIYLADRYRVPAGSPLLQQYAHPSGHCRKHFLRFVSEAVPKVDGVIDEDVFADLPKDPETEKFPPADSVRISAKVYWALMKTWEGPDWEHGCLSCRDPEHEAELEQIMSEPA